MKPDSPQVMRATVDKVNEARARYRAALRGGYQLLEVNLDPDDYATAGYYELGPDERDISGPGLTALRAMGGSLEARVTGAPRRPCVDPATKTQGEFLTLQLTDGWSFVPTAGDLEEVWRHLGTDESSYLGLCLRLRIQADEGAAAQA